MDPSSSQLTVLAVDDSAVFRRLLEQSLSGERYGLLFAKNCRAALDLFTEHQPAVVITDWHMPDIGGPDLCRRTRHDFQGFNSHLILLTSNTDKAQVVEGLAVGADDYLTKPFHYLWRGSRWAAGSLNFIERSKQRIAYWRRWH
jgi:sigma-B regulation protein RsbU (phosphoserine phosphatase)